jgi:hypothetical protein
VRHERNTVGGYLAEYTNGVERSRQFLTWVFSGIDEGEVVLISGGCTIANVNVGSDTSPLQASCNRYSSCVEIDV